MSRFSTLAHSPRARRLAAGLCFVAAIAVNAYTFSKAFQTSKIETPPEITAIADAAELATIQRDLAGTYATGERPGDRVITIERGGTVRFSEIGVTAQPTPNFDLYRIGRVEKSLYLATEKSGAVEVIGIDTLIYFGDRYTRTKSLPTPSDPNTPGTASRRPARAASRRSRHTLPKS